MSGDGGSWGEEEGGHGEAGYGVDVESGEEVAPAFVVDAESVEERVVAGEGVVAEGEGEEGGGAAEGEGTGSRHTEFISRLEPLRSCTT